MGYVWVMYGTSAQFRLPQEQRLTRFKMIIMFIFIHLLGRTVAPNVYGCLFSWSLTNVQVVDDIDEPLGFPLNQYFVFFVTCVISLAVVVLALKLPATIDMTTRQPDERDERKLLESEKEESETEVEE